MNWFGMAAGIFARLPIERWLIKPRDTTKPLEALADKLAESQNKPPISAKTTVSTQEVAPPPKNQAVEAQGTACIPCSNDHLSTCSGLLSEAMRFARKDGIASTEVINRVGLCRDELNAMERVDLHPELTSTLPQWEKEIANLALTGSRELRHNMTEMKTIDDLENVSAKATKLRKEVSSKWMQGRLAQPKQQAMTLDEARRMAAEEAAKEVEERWQSQEKR